MLYHKKNKPKMTHPMKFQHSVNTPDKPNPDTTMNLYRNISMNRFFYPTSYPQLPSIKSVLFTRTITQDILGSQIEFYSANPTLVEYKDHYLLNLRWINYNFHEDGSTKTTPQTWTSLNSRFELDKDLRPISDESFLKEDFEKQQGNPMMGIEDIRLIKMDNQYYYLATCFDSDRSVISVSANPYPVQENVYELERNLITPTHYDKTYKRTEKNWSYVFYQDKLSVVYLWYPLQIGVIENQSLNITSVKSMPPFFKDARGSTPGYQRGHELWFILHKVKKIIRNHQLFSHYSHFFAVFDLEMNLIRYSELFKLGDKSIEFCTSFLIEGNQMLIAYSVLDTQPIISIYRMQMIEQLLWHKLEDLSL